MFPGRTMEDLAECGTKIDAPIWEWRLLAAVAGMGGIHSSGLLPMTSGQMESAANWEFFHDNSSAKCDPAVSGGSPRPVGRMVFDIPAMEGARWYTEQEFAMGETINNIDKFRRREMFSEKLGGCG